MATAQLKEQFDAACVLLKQPNPGARWLNIIPEDLKKAVPSNVNLYTEVNDFLHKNEGAHTNYINDLKTSVNKCIKQISGLIAKARVIVDDKPNFKTLDTCTKPNAPLNSSSDVIIPDLETMPRVGVAQVTPLQRSLRNTMNLASDISRLNVNQNGSYDGSLLDNVFVGNVNEWVFVQFDNNPNISTMTEKWQAVVEEHKQLLEDRFVLEREFEVNRLPGEAFRKCGMNSWADTTAAKLRNEACKFNIKDTKYFSSRENQDWKTSCEAWNDLKAYADSQKVRVEGNKVVYPSSRSDGDIDRWINSLNAKSQMNYTGANSAVKWKERDASGYETRLVQDASRLNAIMLKHAEVNESLVKSESKLSSLGALYWGLTSFRRDMNGVMWSLSRLVQAVFKLGEVLNKLMNDLQTLQVNLWAGEVEGIAPLLESATKNFESIREWLVATDVRRPDQTFHCATGKNDYKPSDPPAPTDIRPPTKDLIQAISGFDLGVPKGTTGLKMMKTENGEIPYMDAAGDTELISSQTSWISFPSFPEYPRYEIGEVKISGKNIVSNGRTERKVELKTGFSTDEDNVGRAIWIKSFEAKTPSEVLDIKLSIENFDAESKSMTVVLSQGKSSLLSKIVIGWLVYTKDPEDPKRIASWQTNYDHTSFVYRLSNTTGLFGIISMFPSTDMMQIPDPQIRSRFYAKTEVDMDWKMAPSVMIGFHRLKLGMDRTFHLRTGCALADKKGFAVDVATWEHTKLFEVGLTIVAAE